MSPNLLPQWLWEDRGAVLAHVPPRIGCNALTVNLLYRPSSTMEIDGT
jgi:hypothetical protein